MESYLSGEMVLGDELKIEKLQRNVKAAVRKDGASYLLNKRSGFIASRAYTEEMQRKRDFYTFTAGSCFSHEFSGDIYDVSRNGGHPVYRYARALFMGV